MILAIMICGTLFCFLMGNILDKSTYSYSDLSAAAFQCIGALGAILSVIAILCIPFNRMQVQAEINGCMAIQTTLAQSNQPALVKAAYLQKIGDCNSDMAQYRYYRELGMQAWIPVTVETAVFK